MVDVWRFGRHSWRTVTEVPQERHVVACNGIRRVAFIAVALLTSHGQVFASNIPKYSTTIDILRCEVKCITRPRAHLITLSTHDSKIASVID